MAVKWETIKAGDTLYRVGRRQMGHTTMRTTYVEPVHVVEIDHAAGTATVSVYGRKERASRYWLTKLRRSKPEMRKDVCGAQHVAPKRRKAEDD